MASRAGGGEVVVTRAGGSVVIASLAEFESLRETVYLLGRPKTRVA